MQFLLIDMATMVAAGFAFVALVVGKRRFAHVAAAPRQDVPRRERTVKHEVRRPGNECDPKPQSSGFDLYVDPRRLVNLR
jgi:hypothetical protein